LTETRPTGSDVAVSVAAAATGDLESRLERLWSVDIPIRLDRWVPHLADAFADGVWTAAWRRVHAFAPLAAFALGFFFRLLWPTIHNVYSESLLFLALVIAGAILSGPAGTMLLFGYALADAAMLPFSRDVYGPGAHLRQFAGHMVGYMLLGIVAILIPQLSRWMADEIASKMAARGDPPLAVRGVLNMAAGGVLIFIWCQAMIVLVRPVFTWSGHPPTTEAVKQVQTRWQWLVAIAILAVLVRVILEMVARSSAGARIRHLEAQRWAVATERGMLWRRTPLIIQVALAAMVATIILAGTYVSTIDALIVLAAIAALKAWRAGLLGSMPDWWAAAVRKIPALARFIIAPLLGFAIANIVLKVFWSSGSLRPVMIGALLTVAIFQLLFPVRVNRRTA
jgi:hypothetical protein